ncbi:hypothetical protein JCM10213_006018 [Rhodosporidiobolus nylandii]
MPSQTVRGSTAAYTRPLPVGPSSLALTAAEAQAFVQEADGVLKQVEDARAKLAGALGLGEGADSGAGGEVGERCSVSGLLTTQTSILSNPAAREDLRTLMQKRWSPAHLIPPPPARGQKRKRGETEEPEGEKEDEHEGEKEKPGKGRPKGRGKGKAKWEKPNEMMDEELRMLVEEAERDGLGLTRSLPQVEHFLRKTKVSDYNSLYSIRPSQIAAPDATPTASSSSAPEPLSNLVYTLVIHPIARRSELAPSGADAGVGRHSAAAGSSVTQRQRIWVKPQRQVLVCLGSNTLADVYRELAIAAEGFPKEVTPEPSPEPSDDEEEEEEQGRMGRLDMGGNIGGGGGKKEKRAKETRWKKERRQMGAVWMVEGVLYGDADGLDEEDGEKKDYAQMVLDLISSASWPSLSTTARPAPSSPQPQDGLALNHFPPPSASDDAASPQPADSSKPQLYAGPSMQQAQLGALNGVRAGQPYWLMCHGNVEVIWSIEEIRYRHPLDPPLESSSSAAPYPLATFLSRPPAPSTSSISASLSSSTAARCRVCDRDPGLLVLIDDELVGETPALVCGGCWEVLHPVVDEADGEEGSDVGHGLEGEKRRFMRQGYDAHGEGGWTVRAVPTAV